MIKRNNATVIPIGLWGTEKVWPRSAKLPDILNLSNPPLVSITVGAPVELDRTGNSDEIITANTQAIMSAISAAAYSDCSNKLLREWRGLNG